jgi:hypothetical protein
MEFVRMRCARLGMNVWCVDTTLHCEFPDLQKDAALALTLDPGQDGIGLKAFKPKMTSHAIVKTVTVKGWNPETKELITGDATVQSSKLGSQTSVAGSGSLGNAETFTVDHPIWSAEEAKALAKARLQDASLSYITGEAELAGNPKLDLGKIVKVVANAMKGEDPFNGNYYIMGLTHRHIAAKAKDGGGYVTIVRFARDAQGQ